MRSPLFAVVFSVAAAGVASSAWAAPQSHDPSINPPAAEPCFEVESGDALSRRRRPRPDRAHRTPTATIASAIAGRCPNLLRPDASIVLKARGRFDPDLPVRSISCVTVTASQFPLTCSVDAIHPMTAAEVAAPSLRRTAPTPLAYWLAQRMRAIQAISLRSSVRPGCSGFSERSSSRLALMRTTSLAITSPPVVRTTTRSPRRGSSSGGLHHHPVAVPIGWAHGVAGDLQGVGAFDMLRRLQGVPAVAGGITRIVEEAALAGLSQAEKRHGAPRGASRGHLARRRRSSSPSRPAPWRGSRWTAIAAARRSRPAWSG